MLGDTLRQSRHEHRLEKRVRRVGRRVLSSGEPQLLFATSKTDTVTLMSALEKHAAGTKIVFRTTSGEALIGFDGTSHIDMPYSNETR